MNTSRDSLINCSDSLLSHFFVVPRSLPLGSTATCAALPAMSLSQALHSSLLLLTSAFFYTRPIVASVGSSIADVTANPLSAW